MISCIDLDIVRLSVFVAFLGVIALMSVSEGQGGTDIPLTKERAQAIAVKAVADLNSRNELVIQEEKTIEREFGWVFFVTTRKYLETKDPGSLMPGIGPLVVNRVDGSAQFLSSSVHPSQAVDEYARRWKESQKAK
jgi:hypothetical protein